MKTSRVRRRGWLLRGLLDPIGTARLARAGGYVTAMRIVMAMPVGIRHTMFRPLLALAARWTRSRPASRYAPPLAFIARRAAGSPAAAMARDLGTSTGTAPDARRALALLAQEANLGRVARRIAATIPGDRSVRLALLRSELALNAGRYGDALDEAKRASAAGVPGAQSLVDIARANLTVLSPGWLPSLGTQAARLEALRGQTHFGRVLHVVSVSLPHRTAGYTVRTQAVAASQLAVGLDAHVMARTGFPLTSRPGDEDVVVARVPYHCVQPSVAIREPDRLLTEVVHAAVPLLQRLRPSVLQPASNYLQAQTALALARPLGIPVVYEVRGFWEESWAAGRSHDELAAMETDRYRLTRETETAAMLAADAVVTLSEVMRNEIVGRGVPAGKIVIVPNAVDVDRFRPIARDDGMAATLGIRPEVPVVGYVTTFNAYEGITYLLEAAARLRAGGRHLHILLVGDGQDEATIRDTGRRLGLDDGTLLMPGRVPHEAIIRYYSLMDVFVVPRTANRVSRLVTPLKPYEAMALERAVVVSDLPALREIVMPGVTGLTFRPEDSDDLADVLGGLLDDPALRNRLGRQGREWIAAERTWASNGRRYRELFERLGVA